MVMAEPEVPEIEIAYAALLELDHKEDRDEIDQEINEKIVERPTRKGKRSGVSVFGKKEFW